MDMRTGLVVDDWERLWKVIQRSFTINRHVEFFRWLQDDVSPFLPHEVLVAAWGDFATGRIYYDVASNIPDIRTQKVNSGCDIDPLMGELYQRWRNGGEQWYILDKFNPLGINAGRPNACIDALAKMQCTLVHGIRDRRGDQDCLYVFFGKGNRVDIQQPIIELLVPQIDAALRRVEALPPLAPADEKGICALAREISDREHQIMEWVRHGKSNHEIGMILNISPNTVKNHLKRIFQKLDVTTRAQAVAKYKEGRQVA